MRGFVRIFAAAASIFLGAAAARPADVLNVAVVKYIRPSPHEPILAPTLKALRDRFGDSQVHVTELTMQDLETAIEERAIDIFIASAGFYRFNVINGARDLAALASRSYPDPNHGEGSAVVVRAESDFTTWADLFSRRIAASTPQGFTTLRVKGEIARRSYDPDRFFSEWIYTGPANTEMSVNLLRQHLVDAAVFRLCWLEDRLKTHPEEKNLWRVIEPWPDTGVCRSSTALYPSWIIATTPATNPEVSRRVTQTVLAMPPTADGQYWTVATDLSAVDQLYRELKVGPFAYLREWNLSRLWTTFQIPIVLFCFFVVGLIVHSLRVTQLVRRRTAQLEEALTREKALQSQQLEAAERISALQRTGLIGRISSMIAHELRQPLAALALYGKSLRKLLEREKASPQDLTVLSRLMKQTERINAIVDNVRAYAKISEVKRSPTDLRNVIQHAAAAWRAAGRADTVTLTLTAPSPVWVKVSALEWELVVLNLLKNASEALAGRKDGQINVTLYEKDDGGVRLNVSDNGPGLTEEKLALLGEPVESAKATGLGLGLSIVKGIVENHASRIRFFNHPLGGFAVEIDLPPQLTAAAPTPPSFSSPTYDA